MTSAWLRNQNKNIFLCLNPECLFAYLIGCCWHEFQGFCGNKHLEPIMPPAWWRHQNKEIFVYLNVDCISFFDKLLLTCVSRVLQNQPWHLWAYNRGGSRGWTKETGPPPSLKFNSIDFMRTKILSWILFYFCCNHPLLPYFYFISFFNYHYLILQR